MADQVGPSHTVASSAGALDAEIWAARRLSARISPPRSTCAAMRGYARMLGLPLFGHEIRPQGVAECISLHVRSLFSGCRARRATSRASSVSCVALTISMNSRGACPTSPPTSPWRQTVRGPTSSSPR